MATVEDTKGGRAIWWLLAGALTVRLAVAIVAAGAGGAETFHMPDSAGYVELARTLGSEGCFTTDGEPEIYRGPGYPILLTLGVMAGPVELVTVAGQILLSCLSVYLVFRMGRLLTGSRAAATAAGAFYAMEPLSVLYCSRILSETLFTTLIVAFAFLLLRYLHGGHRPRQGSLRWLLLSSLCLAGAGYVRPIGYGLAVVVSAVLLVWIIKKRAAVKYVAHVGLFLVVLWGGLGVWQVRNYSQAGYARFSAVSDEALYFYEAAAVQARAEGVSYYEMQQRMGYGDEEVYLALHPEQQVWPKAQRYRFMRAEAWRIIRSAPAGAVTVYGKGVLRTLFDPGGIEYLRLLGAYPAQGGLLGRAVDEGLLAALRHLMSERPGAFWISIALGLMLLDYLSFSMVGMLTRKCRLDMMAVVLISLVAGLLLLSGGPQSEGRFRHPIMPILCVFAGVGLVRMLRPLRRSKSGPDL